MDDKEEYQMTAKQAVVQVQPPKSPWIYRASWWVTKHVLAFSAGAAACVFAAHWLAVGINEKSAEFVQNVTLPANKFIIETLGKAADIAFIQEANAALSEKIPTLAELKEREKNIAKREEEMMFVSAYYTAAMEIGRKCQDMPKFNAEHNSICVILANAELETQVKK